MFGLDIYDWILVGLLLAIYIFISFRSPLKRVNGLYILPMGDNCPDCWTVHVNKKPEAIGMVSKYNKKFTARMNDIKIGESKTLKKAIRQIKSKL